MAAKKIKDTETKEEKKNNNENELPKLPYGMGNLRWTTKDKKIIQYRLLYTCRADGKKYSLAVNSDDMGKCFELMDQKKQETEKKASEKYKHALDNPNITLGNAIEEWMKTFKYEMIKANAYDRIECTLNNQIKSYSIGNMRVKDVLDRDVMNHLKRLSVKSERNGKERKAYSYSVIKKTYQLLDQFFQYYYSRDVNLNPMNTVPMPERKERIGEITEDDANRMGFDPDIVFDDAEMNKFKKMCLSPVKEGVSGSKFGKPIYFMLLTMIRASEACGLLWEDIDIEKKTMQIVKQKQRVKNRDKDAKQKTKLIITTPKSKSSIRIVPLTDEAVKIISDYKRECEFTGNLDPVLATSSGESISEPQLYKTLRGLLKAAGINKDKGDKKFNLHSLRHSGISYYIRHDVPISQVTAIAGHAQEMTTIGTYYHQVEAQKRDALNKMNGIVRKTKVEEKTKKNDKKSVKEPRKQPQRK
jgi:integrase